MTSDLPPAVAVPDSLRVPPVPAALARTGPRRPESAGLRYPAYTLGVLFLVSVLILMDRQILTVLAEDIKADLRLSDADIGFIYGTAISVFYAVFSIPLGRFADVWSRKNLLAICVLSWSSMIFLTSAARQFLTFALCRIGVGVGEAGAAPASLSMIADYFPARLRSTAMSVWAAGVPIGAGLGVFLGGVILDFWSAAFPDPAQAPLGLTGWQAAFVAVALPGPFVALWLASLKEPVRGQSDGLAMAAHPRPFREVWLEMQSVLPVFSLYGLWRLGGGVRTLRLNLLLAGLIASAGGLLTLALGSPAQWAALGLGLWCVTCWAQTLALRDPATFAMIFKCRALMFSNLGFAGYVFVTAGVGTWIVPYLIRAHGVGALEVGSMIGLLLAVFGSSGTVIGGLLSDRLERHTAKARLYVVLGALLLTVPSVGLLLAADSLAGAYSFTALYLMSSSVWYGIGPSIANGLVAPRMRGVSSAFYLIVITLLGVAMGPYVIGHLSDLIAARGAEPAAALRQAMALSLLSAVFTAAMLLAALRNIVRDDASRVARAKALGEPI